MRSTVHTDEMLYEEKNIKKNIESRWMQVKLKEVLSSNYLSDLVVSSYIKIIATQNTDTTKFDKVETGKSEYFESYFANKRENVEKISSPIQKYRI